MCPTSPEAPREDDATAFTKDPPAPLPARSAPAAPDSSGTGLGARSGAIVAWLMILLVIVVLGGTSWLAFSLDRAGTVSFWVYAIAPTLVVAVVAVARAVRDGEAFDMLRPEWGDATRGILSAVLLLGGSVACLHFLAPTGSPRESWVARIYLQLGDPRWLRSHNGLIGLAIFVAAAAEEIVWRGLVTRLIAERVGSRSAWLWAAVCYALAQVPTAWALRDPEAGLNPMLILGALGLGLVWGGMARWSGRLTPSVLSHAGFVWCVVMLFRLWGAGV